MVLHHVAMTIIIYQHCSIVQVLLDRAAGQSPFWGFWMLDNLGPRMQIMSLCILYSVRYAGACPSFSLPCKVLGSWSHASLGRISGTLASKERCSIPRPNTACLCVWPSPGNGPSCPAVAKDWTLALPAGIEYRLCSTHSTCLQNTTLQMDKPSAKNGSRGR